MGDFDPAARVVLPQVNNARQFYLTREQMIHLARHCKSLRARTIIRIAVYSGMRLGEILKAARGKTSFLCQIQKMVNPD